MRRIDLMYETYSDYVVKDIKTTILSRCVSGYIKGATVPVPCQLECEKCWNKELTEREIRMNNSYNK